HAYAGAGENRTKEDRTFGERTAYVIDETEIADSFGIHEIGDLRSGMGPGDDELGFRTTPAKRRQHFLHEKSQRILIGNVSEKADEQRRLRAAATEDGPV